MGTPQSPVSVMGNPVAVTLVGEDSYKRLTSAAHSGQCLLSDGTRIFASQYFRTLNLSLPTLDAGNYNLGILVVNGLPDPLVLSETWLSHCDELNYPTESDLVGYWEADSGNVKSAGQIGGSLNPNTIPGKRSDPLQPGSLYGAGFFYFTANSFFYWNDGAIKFRAGDKDLGICWSHNESNNSSLGVAADMSIYPQSDLATFYKKTADQKATAVYHDQRGGTSMSAQLDHCNDDEVWWDSKLPTADVGSRFLVIVAVEPT